MRKRRYITSILVILLLGALVLLPMQLIKKNLGLKKPSVQGTSTEYLHTNQDKQQITPKPIEIIDPIDEKISNMSLEEKIGQMFMGGSYKADLFESQLQLVKDQGFGGIVLFRVNVSSPEVTKESMKRIEGVKQDQDFPLFITIDEEGGVVTRLRNQLGEQSAQGEIHTYQEAYDVGFNRGKELSNLGINVNFAPVLDYSPSENSFMYDRTFHTNQKEIALLSNVMITGYRDGGVVAVPKHFPGHPNDSTDSHSGLPVSNVSKEEFDNYASQFKDLIESTDPEMIMVGHISFPNVDPKYPSTLSSVILKDILRDQYGFEGIVISDDINMGAIKESFHFEESAVRAVEAGNDIILVVTEPKFQLAAYNAVLQNVKNGRVSEERIDESIYRILKVKGDL